MYLENMDKETQNKDYYSKGSHIVLLPFNNTGAYIKVVLKKFIVVDIDGTVSKCAPERIEYMKNIPGKLSPAQWLDFYKFDFTKDEPILPMIEYIRSLSKNFGILFCTNRSEFIREQTNEWLTKYFPEHFELLMRPKEDLCNPGTQVKKEVLLRFFEKYPYHLSVKDVACVFEDEPEMVTMWRNNGLLCFQV